MAIKIKKYEDIDDIDKLKEELEKETTTESTIKDIYKAICRRKFFLINKIEILNMLKNFYRGDIIDFNIFIYGEINLNSNDESKDNSFLQNYLNFECSELIDKYAINTNLELLKIISKEDVSSFLRDLRLNLKEAGYVDKELEEYTIKLGYLLLMVGNNLYIGCLNYNRAVELEREITKFFVPVDDDFYKCKACKYTYDAITKKDFKDRIKGLEYLQGNLSDEKDDLLNRLDERNDRIEVLLQNNQNLVNQNNYLKDELDLKSEKIITLKNEITRLNDEISKCHDEKEFDDTTHKMQYKTLKEDLFLTLKEEFEYEINGIEELIDYLDDKNQRRFSRRINRLKEILDNRLSNK